MASSRTTVQQPATVLSALVLLAALATVADAQQRYTASLSPPPYKPKDGDNSPAPPQSNGQGTAEFSIGVGQGTYSLTLTSIPDFYQATLNLRPAGNATVGPVTYILVSGNGTAAAKSYTGKLSPSNFVGPLQFQDFTGLTKALDSGLAYVNIRTNSFPISAIQGRVQSASASSRPASRRLLWD